MTQIIYKELSVIAKSRNLERYYTRKLGDTVTQIPVLSPIEALITAEAYIILADKKALPEERAALVGLLGKHVSKKELSQHQVQTLTADAFAFVGRHEFESFLVAIESSITPAQIFAIAANMYETMIIDGNVIAREKELVDDFCKFFDIDRRVINILREVLFIKNDTGLFLRQDHPNNGSDFRFGFLDRMDTES